MYHGIVEGHTMYVIKKTRASRAAHYISENITKDGTQAIRMANRPDGTCEAYDDAWYIIMDQVQG